MPSFRAQVRIRAMQDRVFEFLADPAVAKSWVIGLIDIVPSSPGSLQVVGGRFKETFKEGRRLAEYEGKILAYDRPRAYAVQLDNARFSITIHYSLDPYADGTVVNQSVDLNPQSSFVGFMLSLFSFFTKLMLKKQMTQLKKTAERRTELPPFAT